MNVVPFQVSSFKFDYEPLCFSPVARWCTYLPAKNENFSDALVITSGADVSSVPGRNHAVNPFEVLSVPDLSLCY